MEWSGSMRTQSQCERIKLEMRAAADAAATWPGRWVEVRSDLWARRSASGSTLMVHGGRPAEAGAESRRVAMAGSTATPGRISPAVARAARLIGATK